VFPGNGPKIVMPRRPGSNWMTVYLSPARLIGSGISMALLRHRVQAVDRRQEKANGRLEGFLRFLSYFVPIREGAGEWFFF